jgi:hypothetical protein
VSSWITSLWWNLKKKEKERSMLVKERSWILKGSVDHCLQPTTRTAMYLWRILHPLPLFLMPFQYLQIHRLNKLQCSVLNLFLST